MFDYNKIDFTVEKFQLFTPKHTGIWRDIGVGLRVVETGEPIAVVKDS